MEEDSTVQRAFDLVRDGRARTLAQLRQILVSERHLAVDAQLAAHGVRARLLALMAQPGAALRPMRVCHGGGRAR
ncbi:hypothetical protein TPR58_18220 [Sphingomonas sp. HF-S3]|uniref:Uncharacterized protein n=1 Tax=Sphingomonas rustica TaxID=3103142 RepID=A0ABV0BD00_9SPHN